MPGALYAILFAGVLAAVFALSFRVKRARDHKEKRRSAERARRVRHLGWEYEPKHTGDVRYRFRGRSPNGVAWQMHYDSNRSSRNALPKLVWRADALAAERTEVAIGSRRTYEAFTGGVARTLLAGAARAFGRFADGALQDLNDFVRDARPLAAGSARFRQHFVLAARDARFAQLVDADVERLILDWPKVDGKRLEPDRALHVRLDRAGLHAQIQVDAPPMAVCEQLVRLGERIADGLRATRAH
jgi:hypothetical protein